MSAFDEAVFWPAFKAAGFLRSASVKQGIRPAVTVDVGYVEPETLRFDQTRSKDYEIEYQHADLPALAEGDPVTFVDAEGVPLRNCHSRFRVREVPFVSDLPGDGNTGFWRRALLTRL